MIVGIIGLGSIGARHAANLIKMGHEVVGYDVVSAPATGNDAMDCSVWIVATPTVSHYSWLSSGAAEAAHVLIEKPIADAIDNVDGRIINFDENKKVLKVGYMCRFHSCVKKAKEWIDAGMLGSPLWASFCCAQANEKYHKDDIILNWSHEIDLAFYLFGPATVKACVTDSNNAMADLILYHAPSMCRTSIHLDYLAEPEHRGFTLIGTKGQITCSLADRIAVYKSRSGDLTIYHGEDTWNDNYVEEMQDFLGAVNGKPSIGCSGQEGLEVLKICLEARRLAGEVK